MAGVRRNLRYRRRQNFFIGPRLAAIRELYILNSFTARVSTPAIFAKEWLAAAISSVAADTVWDWLVVSLLLESIFLTERTIC